MDGQAVAASFQEFLLDRGLVTRPEMAAAEQACHETGQSLHAALRTTSAMEGRGLARAVSEFTNVPMVDDDAWLAEPPDCHVVSVAFMYHFNVLPLLETRDGVVLAMENPADREAIKGVRLALQRPIIARVAAAQDIHAAIARLERLRDSEAVQPVEMEVDDNEVEHLRDLALGAPVVRFVNQMLQEASQTRATDIHIEPFNGRVSVRMRIDGLLRQTRSPPAGMARAIASRIKILAGMNIAERRLSQDGRARIEINQRRMDLRIATMPTIHGEAVAIRLLDNVRRVLDLRKLGFDQHEESVIRRHLTAPHGLVIVTGPTGSGKTTTLAAALSILNKTHRKILTIEDPIEYEIDGINQTQTKPAIGLTFANVLRSFLRHDPDILMVGEMRDAETASISVHAALTGHLVLTTLHTNTAAGAVPRLMDMGIEPFLLASSLRCVVAQRLVRVLCERCKVPDPGTRDIAADAAHALKWSGPSEHFWKGAGCEHCAGTGYHERTVVSEVLDVGEDIRALIVPGARSTDVESVSCRNGMTTMMQDDLRKCLAGITSIDEVRRVAIDM